MVIVYGGFAASSKGRFFIMKNGFYFTFCWKDGNHMYFCITDKTRRNTGTAKALLKYIGFPTSDENIKFVMNNLRAGWLREDGAIEGAGWYHSADPRVSIITE